MGGKAAKERRRLERLAKHGSSQPAKDATSKDTKHTSDDNKNYKKSSNNRNSTKSPSKQPAVKKPTLSKNPRQRLTVQHQHQRGPRDRIGRRNENQNKSWKTTNTTRGGPASQGRQFGKQQIKGKPPVGKDKAGQTTTKTTATPKKEKKFKKPKHLKRKLEQAQDEKTRKKLMEEAKALEEVKQFQQLKNNNNNNNKKLSKTMNETNKRVFGLDKTKPTKKVETASAVKLTTLNKENYEPMESHVVEKPVTNEGSRSTQDAEKTIPPSKPLVTKKSVQNEASKQIPDPLVDEEPCVDEKKGTASPGPKHPKSDQHDDSESDDNSSVEEDQTVRRQRGKRRRGRQNTQAVVDKQETNQMIKETETKDEPKIVSMTKPQDTQRRCIGRKALTDFVVGQRYPGKVVYMKPFGVFIDIMCHKEAFCHISRVDDGFVESPDKVLSIGDEVNPRILEIDRRKKQITVSLQSDAREEDEKKSINERQERSNKRRQKKPSKDKRMRVRVPDFAEEPKPPHTPKQEADTERTTITTTNTLVDEHGNYLKPESEMTPAELKRARKLSRRAARRTQKDETGISA